MRQMAAKLAAQWVFIYANDYLEGNALETISAMVSEVD
jgi:hypothetical protein